MIVTGLLTAIVIWFLFLGKTTPVLLGVISVSVGIALGTLGRHSHGGARSIETIAVHSKLNAVSPALKTWASLAFLALSVASGAEVGIILTILSLALQIYFGKIRLHEYLSLLAIPLNFLLISALALLFEWATHRAGLFSFGLFGGFYSISVATQMRTILVISRALGALSCLYVLSLSTPLHEIIGVMRRAHIPIIITDLMYLIHRYLFFLLELHSTMHKAAESRLGYCNYATSIRSTGMVYTNLLIRSFHQANVNFDAMESRCFDGEITFLEQEKPALWHHVVVTAGVFILVLAVSIWRSLV